ncbi:MAG: molecular chaperone DnaJ [Myxococcales bacterium]|nr:molecular chaperone DnaJ [Myxococcales bacterium]
MSSAPRDYYTVLGVSRDVDAAGLKAAYRKLVIQYHPDRNPGDAEAEARFREATEAYTVLSDEERRKRYDRYGHAAFGEPGKSPFEGGDFGSVADMLEGLFGEVFRRRKKHLAKDLTYDLTVSFVEAALGAEKKIRVTRSVPCMSCRGTGAAPGSNPPPCAECKGTGETKLKRGFLSSTRPCVACGGKGVRILEPCPSCSGRGKEKREDELTVRIPPGVQDGAVRTVRGGGEIEPDSKGDLHVTVHIEKHPLFERDGADVRMTLPVSVPMAALGATVEVPTLEGKVQMKIPPGTQSGKVFRLRGRGIPVFGGAAKGDQLVTIQVEIPQGLGRKHRKLLEELEESLPADAHPVRAAYLDTLRKLGL